MTQPPTCDDPRSRVPRAYVARPGPGPAIQYGLFSAARIIENPDRHELNGIEHEPVCNTEVYEWPAFCGSYGLYAPTGQDRLDIGRPDPRCDPYPLPQRWVPGVGRWSADRTEKPDRRKPDGTPYTEGYENPAFLGGPYTWTRRKPDGTYEQVTQEFNPPYALKRVDETKGLTWADPFAVYAGESCFLGNSDNDTATRNLRERFELGEQETVERVIYNGFLPDYTRLDWDNPAFPDPARPYLRPALRWDPLILNDGRRTRLNEAIGLLEHWIQADSAARGVIHAPAYMATTLTGKDVVSTRGPRTLTRLGHTFVFGTGYSGRKPLYDGRQPVPDIDPAYTTDTTPPEQRFPEAWLYITRPVTVRRSAVIEPADWTSGAVNQRNNTGAMEIERLYVVDWPCVHAAVRTDYPLYGLDGWLPDPLPPPPAGREQHTTAHIEEESSR